MSPEVAMTKMSGAGNDFIVVGRDALSSIGMELGSWVRRVCRRRLSVGADGVLIVEPGGPGRVKVSFRNPDGSPAFCGNGSRCAARFAFLNGWVESSMILETIAGEVRAELDGDRVRLRLAPPTDHGELDFNEGADTIRGRFVRAGAPHVVVIADQHADGALHRWGPRVRRDRRFEPEGTNLDLVSRRADGALGIRTWERGVEGETLSCGSGAIAAAFAARLGGGRETVTIVPASGVALRVELPGPASRPEAAVLEGDARVIFRARLCPEALDAPGGWPPPRGS